MVRRAWPPAVTRIRTSSLGRTSVWSPRRNTPADEHLRLAVISNPRSGNMWLRRLLVAMYQAEERSAHTPEGVGWDALPTRCVLQIHWPDDRSFRRKLKAFGFRIVVLVRHPFDALLSILQFAPHEPATAQWLAGAHGDESAILGATPISSRFAAYATSPRSQALLGVSPRWWRHAAVGLRYEDLVADAEHELLRVERALGVPARVPAADAASLTRFADLAAEAQNSHFWQGRPGHWRELLPRAVVSQIAPTHRKLVDRFGYDATPDPTLTKEEALRRWLIRTS